MKNSKTTIRELTAKYRSILKKCALFNAAVCLAVVGVAGTANADYDYQEKDYDYPAQATTTTERIGTYTGTASIATPMPSETYVVSDAESILNMGTRPTLTTPTIPATVNYAGILLLNNFAQLNVYAGSTFTISGTATNAGTLINESQTFEVGNVGLEYDGPRYVQIYDKAGQPTRDTNAYAINNFGTITADEIRNKETIINNAGAEINANITNIVTVDGDGKPQTISTFENHGTINGDISNAGTFYNDGTINATAITNSGTFTSSMDFINATATFDNTHGTFNTYGTLNRDLIGTVNFQYSTKLLAGNAHVVNGIATNTGTFLVNGDFTVNNAYSSFSNHGTLDIDGGSVTANINNTGMIKNMGKITGDVSNASNATLTSALDDIDGKVTNYADATLNTWGELGGHEASLLGNVDIVDDATISDSDLYIANAHITGKDVGLPVLNMSSKLTVSDGRALSVDWMTIDSTNSLELTDGASLSGKVINYGGISNYGSNFNASIENYGSFFNNGTGSQINGTDFFNMGNLYIDNMSQISGSTNLENYGTLYTSGSVDRDLGGTVVLWSGTSDLGANVTLNKVYAVNTFNVGKVLTLTDELRITDISEIQSSYIVYPGTPTLNISSTGIIRGNITNNGIVNNYGAMGYDSDHKITNNGTINNNKKIIGTLTNYGVVNNNAGAEIKEEFTHMNSVADSFVNNGTVSATFTNYGNTKNNNLISGDVTNNSFLYNLGSAEISGDVTNNASGYIQNLAKITGDITNTGTINNQATATGKGIIDSEIVNNGTLINSENARIINTVTNSSAADPSITNGNTLMNYGFIQTKNIVNNALIHNLGIMGDNVEDDGTIATSYSELENNSVIYNNRVIKMNTVVNNGIIENYNLLATNDLTNNSGAAFRNQGNIGTEDSIINVANYGSLYNGGVIYGNVTNYAGATLTSPIYSITGTLSNQGTLETWGNLENVNGINLNGTTVLKYDSSLKQNATMKNVTVDPGVTLDLGTNKLTANSFVLSSNSAIKLNVTSKDTYGSIQASNYSYPISSAKLSFVLDRGILSEGTTINLPVFTLTSGNPVNINFSTIENNRYTVTKEDNGTYTISYAPSSSGQILNFGGDQNVIRATTAWLDEEDMPANTPAAKIQSDLNTLNQTDMGSYVKAVRSLMPETAPVAYTLANTVNNKIAEAVEGRFFSRKISKPVSEPKKVRARGRNGGDTINRTTGSVWAKGLYNKAKLNTKTGFEAKTDGVAFGIDGKANDNLTIGVGYAYTGSDVESKSRDTDVKTHTGILYTEYAMGQCFMNAVINYNRSEYEESKTVAGTNADAKHTSDAAYARVMGGFHVPASFFIFTPEAGLRYLWVKMNGYTDKAGQVVSDESSSSLTGVVGLRVGAKTKLIGLDQVLFWPEVSVRGTYDIVDPENNTMVTLPNGSSYTVRGENLERLGGEVTTRLGMLSGNVEVSLEYTGKFRKDYYDHTGLVSLKYRF